MKSSHQHEIFRCRAAVYPRLESARSVSLLLISASQYQPLVATLSKAEEMIRALPSHEGSVYCLEESTSMNIQTTLEDMDQRLPLGGLGLKSATRVR